LSDISNEKPKSTAKPLSLSEDWIATLVGLFIVFVVASGLLGPGPQSVSVKAAPDAQAQANARAMGGWRVSATVGSDRLDTATAPKTLSNEQIYTFTCEVNNAQENVLTVQETVRTDSSETQRPPQIIVDNQCGADVTVSYTTNAAIPYPIFYLFGR
jgi:hypothetical protein